MVAVEALVDRREPAVNGSEAADSGVVDALDGADPQFEVWTDGVFHQHGNIRPAQRVGNFLHGEGVGCRAGADPQQVDAAFQRCGYVFAGSYLGRGVHSRFALHALEPGDARFADAFETSGFGAGLPESGAVEVEALGGQRTGRAEDLFLGFGAAGTADYQGAFGIDSRECDGLNVVHDRYDLFVFKLRGWCIRHIRRGCGSRS